MKELIHRLIFVLFLNHAAFVFCDAAGKDVSVNFTPLVSSPKVGRISDLMLSVRAEGVAAAPGRQVYLVQVKPLIYTAGLQKVRGMVLWWTTPSGDKTTILMKPADDGFWANRVEMASQTGKHSLTLIAFSEAEKQTVETVRQQVYCLDLPQILLTRDRKTEEAFPLTVGSAGSLPRSENQIRRTKILPKSSKSSPSSFSLSFPVMIILASVLMVFFIMFVAIIFRVLKRLPAVTAANETNEASLIDPAKTSRKVESLSEDETRDIKQGEKEILISGPKGKNGTQKPDEDEPKKDLLKTIEGAADGLDPVQTEEEVPVAAMAEDEAPKELLQPGDGANQNSPKLDLNDLSF